MEGFGAFEAWQTAALNAYKKPLLRPWGALEPLLWPCGGFCVRQWRVLGLLGYLFLVAELAGPFPCGAGRTFGGFGVARVGGLLGYLFLAELAGLLEGLEGFGAFEAWQTAALNAYKKPLLRPWGALEPLLWPCGGFCVRQWRVLGLLGYLFPAELAGLLGGLEGLEGFGGFWSV